MCACRSQHDVFRRQLQLFPSLIKFVTTSKGLVLPRLLKTLTILKQHPVIHIIERLSVKWSIGGIVCLSRARIVNEIVLIRNIIFGYFFSYNFIILPPK